MLDLLARFSGRTEIYLAAVVVIVAAVLSVLSPYFLTVSNFIDLIETYSVTAILAMGLFVVLVSGGIDISFAATASVAQYVATLAGTDLGWPAYVCIPLGLGIGILLGCVNALLIPGRVDVGEPAVEPGRERERPLTSPHCVACRTRTPYP